MPDNGDLLERAANELERALQNSTQGKWKIWGMSVMADQGGSSDVDRTQQVADTFFPWDANLICILQHVAPAIITLLRQESYWADLDAEASYAVDIARAILGEEGPNDEAE